MTGEYSGYSEISEELEPEKPPGAPPVLGVLFVHGLGEARQGETLAEEGEPFFNWLQYWLKRTVDYGVPDLEHDHIQITRTFLSRPDPESKDRGTPAYALVEFKPPSEPAAQPSHQWVMAECWWAADFPQASFANLWNWGIGVAPWIFARTATNIVNQMKLVTEQIDGMVAKRVETARSNRPSLTIPLLLSRALVSFFLLFGQVLLTVLLKPLILLGGLLGQVLIFSLVVLGSFPPARNLVASLQESLASNFGDGYVMAANPLSLEAMITQVQHDIHWLRSAMMCDKIALIAHSGGAAVCYHALQDPSTPQVDLLVTYGNGLSKLESIRSALNRRGFEFAAGSVLRVIAILSFIGAVIALIAGQPPSWGLIGVLFAASLALEFVSRWLSERDKQSDRVHIAYPKTEKWLDFYAAADPAPDGPLGKPDNAGGRPFTSTLVTNLHSPLNDHGQYWYNSEQFLAPVTKALSEIGKAEQLIPGADEKSIKAASARRRIRTFLYMATGLLLLLDMPVLWLSLGGWVYSAGNWLANPLIRFFGGPVDIFPGSTQEPTRLAVFVSVLIGLLLFALPVVAYKNMVLFTWWREWSAVETDAMFERNYRQVGMGLARAFLLASLLVPLTAFLAAFGGFGLPWLDTLDLHAAWREILRWLTGTPATQAISGSLSDPANLLAVLTQTLAALGLVLSVGVAVLGLGLSSFKSEFLAGWEEKHTEQKGEETSALQTMGSKAEHDA